MISCLRRFWIVLHLAVAGLCIGCGSSGGKVQVQVSLDNESLAGALVTFEADGGGARGTYSGMTGPDGKAELQMPASTPGVPPGNYRVSVIKHALRPGVTPPPNVTELDELRARGLTANTVPLQYASVQTTPLTAQVKPGPNVFPFDLSSK